MKKWFDRKENEPIILAGWFVICTLIIVSVILITNNRNNISSYNTTTNVMENNSANTVEDDIQTRYSDIKEKSDSIINSIDNMATQILQENGIEFVFKDMKEGSYTDGSIGIVCEYMYKNVRISVTHMQNDASIKSVIINKENNSEKISDLEYFAIVNAVAKLECFDLNRNNFATDNDYDTYKTILIGIGLDTVNDVEFVKDSKKGTVSYIDLNDWIVFAFYS